MAVASGVKGLRPPRWSPSSESVDVGVVRHFARCRHSRSTCPRHRRGPRCRPHLSTFKSGFACFVGRPNAGKSTLTNALVGQKIVDHLVEAADHPARRTRDRAPAGRAADPGRHPWPAQAADAARRAAQRPGEDHLGRGRRDRGLPAGQRQDRPGRPVPGQRGGEGREDARRSRWPPRPTWSSRTGWLEQLAEIADAGGVGRDRVGRDRPGLRDVGLPGRRWSPTSWSKLLPEGFPLYPDGDITDEPEEMLVAELIREAALEGVRDELPHSIAVTIDEMGLREDRPDGQAAARRVREHLPRAGQPEGHRDRPQGRPAARGRRGRPPPDRGAARVRRSTSTCTSRSPRTGRRDAKQLRKLGF